MSRRRIRGLFAVGVAAAAVALPPSGALEYELAPGPYTVENMGSPLSANTQEHQVMFRDSSGDLHLLVYYDVEDIWLYPLQILDVNLSDSTYRLVDGVLGRPGSNGTAYDPARDKIYLGSGDPGYFMAYDLATGAVVNYGRLANKGLQFSEFGDDGWLYMGENVWAGLERFNPATGAIQNFGELDPANHASYYSYTVGADADFAYVGLGQQPWYLGIVNLQTADVTLHWKEDNDTGGRVYKAVGGGWYYERINSGQPWYRKWYHLANGAPVEIAAGAVPALFPWYKRGNVIREPAYFADEFNVEVNLDQAYPDSGNTNTAVVRWRTVGEAAWQSVSVSGFRLMPVSIKRLWPWTGNLMMGFASFYGPVFTYDTASSNVATLGRTEISNYDWLINDTNDIFICGYAAATLRYDPGKPWTLGPSTPDMYDTSVNPYKTPLAAGKYHYYMARGANGYIYQGGHHERDSSGGELEWYDPVSNKVVGALRDPLLDYDVRDLKAAVNGAKLVYSSTSNNTLFVIDAADNAIERAIVVPLPATGALDKVVETEPGVMAGVVGAYFYRVNILTGATLMITNLPAQAFGSISSYDRRLTLGPDGFIWIYLGDSLYRIDPADGSAQEIYEDTDSYSTVFQGNDLIIYGDTEVRRIRNLFIKNHYVSASGTNAVPPFDSWARATTNIQAALDCARAGESVLVSNGAYRVASQVMVTNGVTLRSLNGCSRTTVFADWPACTTRVFYVADGGVLDGVTVSNGHWWGNAGLGGGGAYAVSGSTVRNCYFTHNACSNTSGEGGGGGLYAAAATVRNCLVANNASLNGSGGGVYVSGEGSAFESCTVAGNYSAGEGGGLCLAGTIAYAVNSIVGGNSTFAGDNRDIYDAVAGNQGAFSNCCSSAALPAGQGNIAADPAFIGGGSWRLGGGSPCIDAGTNRSWAMDALDLDEHARIRGPRVDMGAYEYGGGAMSVSPLAFTNCLVAGNRAVNEIGIYSTNDYDLYWHIAGTSSWAAGGSGRALPHSTNAAFITNDSTGLAGRYASVVKVIATNNPDYSACTSLVSMALDVITLEVSPEHITNSARAGFNAANRSLLVASAGVGSYSYAVTTNGAVPWLIVSNGAGLMADYSTSEVGLSYASSGLEGGIRTGVLEVATSYGGGRTQPVEVVLNIIDFGVSPGALASAALRGFNATGGVIGVSAGGGRMSFEATAQDGGRGWLAVSPESGDVSGSDIKYLANSFRTAGLGAGDYTGMVAVATGEGGGITGTVSVAVRIWERPELGLNPSAAYQVVDSGGNPSGVFFNVWNNSGRPRVGMAHRASLASDPVGMAQAVSPAEGVSTGDLDAVGVSFRDMSGFAPGTYTAEVMVAASDSGSGYAGSWSASNIFRAVVSIASPDAPGNIRASKGDYDDHVGVSWDKAVSPSGGAVTYNVLRNTAGDVASARRIASGLGTTSYDDATAEPGVKYYYWLESVNANGRAGTNSAHDFGYRRLAAPGGLSASAGAYTDRVAVSWSAPPGAAACELWRSAEPLAQADRGAVKIAETSAESYDDTAVAAGQKYYYWARSKNALTASAFSSRAEGYAAGGTVDIALWHLVVQPRRVGTGQSPKLISFRLQHAGGAALAGDNGMVRLTFYASGNDVFGDEDDAVIGAVDQRLRLAPGASGIFTLPGGIMTMPGAAGAYYIFMRLSPAWPSTLAPAAAGGWMARRADALEVSAAGSINYQALNDYDGDGLSDMAVYGNGVWDARSVDGFELARNYHFGFGGMAVMGDYDGDARSDPVVYLPAVPALEGGGNSGLWHGLLSGSGYGYASGWFGGPGYVAAPGDYDGDGKTDAAVYDTGGYRWYAIKAAGGWVIQGLGFGADGFEPVIGDYDGDGLWDLALYEEKSGRWFVRNFSGALLVAGEVWGGAGFRPVAGDYDGDGAWDYAVHDLATGRWYVINNLRQTLAAGTLWGAEGYRPVSGDFDGDGLYDFAVYNPVSGKWFIRTVAGTWLLLNSDWGGQGRRAVGGAE